MRESCGTILLWAAIAATPISAEAQLRANHGSGVRLSELTLEDVAKEAARGHTTTLGVRFPAAPEDATSDRAPIWAGALVGGAVGAILGGITFFVLSEGEEMLESRIFWSPTVACAVVGAFAVWGSNAEQPSD